VLTLISILWKHKIALILPFTVVAFSVFLLFLIKSSFHRVYPLWVKKYEVKNIGNEVTIGRLYKSDISVLNPVADDLISM